MMVKKKKYKLKNKQSLKLLRWFSITSAVISTLLFAFVIYAAVT